MQKPLWGVSAVLLAFLVPQVPVPAGGTPCLVTHDQLPKAIRASVQPTGGPSNGGLDNNEWAAAVARDGTVCALTFSGGKPQDQWPASRGIAVEKANTAKAISLKQFAPSTDLYAGARPAGPLFGMAASDPVVPDVLHVGEPSQFGSEADPTSARSTSDIGSSTIRSVPDS